MDQQAKYIRSKFISRDPILQDVLQSIEKHGMPAISVPPEVGRLITLITKISGSRKVLEIGALGGYSGIHIMRGLPADGQLTSLEINPEYARLAEENLEKAGFAGRVSYYTGPALESLHQLKEEGRTFDLFLIDADKKNYENYLEHAVKLANPGAVICADNVLWRGNVYDLNDHDKVTVTMRRFNERCANHPRLESLIIPIGDGLLLSRVKNSDETVE
ncbi:MAG TPA: O-methyltransferase [Bacillales bacterium]|nr:O-methyltransferase [Bacillales bacterium]